jgi:formylglycine-generating enzyme required for sulfatase activity
VLTFVLLTLIASGGIWVSQNFSRVRELPGKLLGPRLFVEPQNQDVGRDSPVEWRVRVTSFATPSYQWYYTLSSNTPARALPNATQELYRLGPVQAGDEGFYAVVVSNRWGAMTSRWARLDVKVGPPGLDPDQPADQEVNPGQDAQFQIGLSITGPVKVQWYREGRPLAGETNTLLVVRGATGPEAADYSAVVMNRSGSVTSRIAQLRVRVPPALVEQPQSQPASAGRRVELAARATGSEPLIYQWRTRSGPVPNGRSARLTFSRVEPEQAGDYCVVVSNPAGSQTSQWATLTVSIPPPTITREPVAQEVNEGGEAVFSIQVDELNGWGPFNFQWSRDGQALAGATGRELRLASVKLGQAGDYAVRVSNASASAISQPARLTVRPPEPPKILSPPRSQTVKAGRSAELAVEVTGAQPISYQWYQDARLLPGQTKATLSITNAQLTHTGTYTLTVKNHLGTVSSPGTRLAVTPNLELDVHPQSTGSPRRSTVVLEARAVGDEPIGIQWHKNNRAVPGATGPTLRLSPLNPSDAGDYYVVVTNRIQALTSRHAQLTVTEPPPIKWTNSLGMVFVSVPKLDVLFCIWQTRVRDFDEFARISPHDGGRPGLMTWAPDHPVTRASWLDAQAFYGWLNDKERRLPKPVPGGLYRLPTDEEWSVAVGLAEPLGATPQARDVLKPTDLYPFSTGAKGGPWPPPAGAGNYADRTAKNSHRDWIVIDNYDDGFPETAPVQSFSANAHGLFGLGHNVREWCEDWWDAQKTERVIRGASYRSYQPLDLLSGTRTHGRPDTRLDDLGFRLVITLPAQK